MRRAATRALPLYGIPFAIKDNIDVAGLPTTAACPAFAYQPGAGRHRRGAAARAPARIVIGKTNLDQFATGLVGVRSPYGIPRNPFDPSSSPAARARARRSRSRPGSCRSRSAPTRRARAACRPALNNIVGLKPSLGLVSTAGVVPACRTLDCVSVFALTVDDAWTALAAIAGADAADPYSRTRPLGAPGAMPHGRAARRAVAGQRMFFGDRASAGGLRRRRSRGFAALGAQIVEIDFEPFYETARLLYEGPWVAERYLAARSLHRVVAGRDPSGDAARSSSTARVPSAVDAFAAFYELEELRRVRDRMFRDDRRAAAADGADGLHRRTGAGRSDRSSTAGSAPTPTSSTCSICAASRCRRRCGRTACRSASRCSRRPGDDALLASIGRAFHADTGLPLGALEHAAAAACADLAPRPRPAKSPSRSSARICPACRSTAS